MSKGFTLLELIVVLAIIGTTSMLIAPSFKLSEDSAENKFAPFVSFIENERNKVIASGDPAFLELDTEGTIKSLTVKKDENGKYPIIAEENFPTFSMETSINQQDKKSKSSIVLMPNGTIEPFILKLPEVTKQLIFNGTASRGKIL